MIDLDTLHFPAEIAEIVGLDKNEINYMKRRGCPFYGKKTTVRWVRAFIARETGAESLLAPRARPRRSAANKPHEPVLTNG